jgi:hypothetical protein
MKGIKSIATWFLLAFGFGLAQGSLTLYTSEVLGDVNALVEAFRKENPGVEVKVFRSGTGEVVAKLRAELEAGNPQPDLIWFANPEYFRELSGKGLLRRVPPTVPGYPVQYAYEGGRYYEVRLLYNVIAVNPEAQGGETQALAGPDPTGLPRPFGHARPQLFWGRPHHPGHPDGALGLWLF